MSWRLAVLLCCCGLARAAVVDIDGVEEEDGEARTVFTSGGTYYIALNTTYLLYYSLLLGTSVHFTLAFVRQTGLIENCWCSAEFSPFVGYKARIPVSSPVCLTLLSHCSTEYRALSTARQADSSWAGCCLAQPSAARRPSLGTGSGTARTGTSTSSRGASRSSSSPAPGGTLRVSKAEEIRLRKWPHFIRGFT